ncbi:MAG: caspase family protein [Ignavibacteriales bacterium]|nr:caspase family protein [Ignavibacteriales bacterium]
MHKKLLYVFAVGILSISPLLNAQIPYTEPSASTVLPNTQVTASAISVSAEMIAVASSEKEITLLSMTTLKPGIRLHLQSGRSFGLAFTPDGRYLVSGVVSGELIFWNISSGTISQTLQNDGGVRSIAINDQGKMVSGGGTATKVWSLAAGKVEANFPPSTEEIIQNIFNPQGNLVLSASIDGRLRLLDPLVPTVVLRTFGSRKVRISHMAFAPDGRTLAVAYADSTIQLWNAQTGDLISTTRDADGPLTALVFHPNGRWLLTGGKEIKIRNVADAALLKSVAVPGVVQSLYLLAGGSTIAVVTVDGSVNTYRLLDKKPDVLPPSITILRPAPSGTDAYQIYADGIEVYGIVSDNSNLSSLTIDSVNIPLSSMMDVPHKPSDSAAVVKSFTANVALRSQGSNAINLTAKDSAGNASTSQLRVVKLSKDAAVELINPRENSETNDFAAKLEFKINFDFASYSIGVNNFEIIKKENISKKPIGTMLTEQVPLSAGLNQLQLIVATRSGERMRRAVKVSRRILSGPVAAQQPGKPAPASTGRPQQWAVVVGVSEYEKPSIKNLNYADRDAREFADYLKSPAGGGFEEARVRVLLNKEATLQNIKSALNQFLRQTVDKDLVIIYFAGHGAPEPANPSNNYLLCYDTDPTSLETTAFPMWDINTALQRYIPSKRVVVLTDACHSGGISTELATRGMGTVESNLINQYLSDLSKSKEGIIVFTASQSGEVSQELDKFGHGVFTHFLLQGLKGEADRNNDYTVTIGELMDYVEEMVKRQTNGNQHPTRNQGTYDTDMTIGLVPH